MAYIYAYAADAADCASIGLVGALLDEDAEFDLTAGEFGELTFRHPVDGYGKYRALQNGAILKTMVPMRLCPGLREDGTYIASVDEYEVARTATKNQRYIYSKKKDGRKKKLLKAGQAVTVTGVADASDDQSRYAVRLGRVSGWMERGGLTPTRWDVVVPSEPGGVEAVAPSYAVRQQLFRIYEVSPCAGAEAPGYIDVKAHRIAYDLLGNISFYRSAGVVSCRAACEGILGNTIMPHDFNIYTDIGDTRPGFDAWDKNPIEALLDPDAGVIARWGAEIVADDYDIYVLRRAGLDRGVRIDYGRNLTGVKVREDASKVVTAIRARGERANGGALYLDGHAVNGRHGYNYDAARNTCADWLPEGYRFYALPDGTLRGSTVVREDRAADALPCIEVLEVEDARVEKSGADVTAAVARRRLAAAAVARFEGGCDEPEISMEVDFVLLGDSQEYRQYRHLEPLFIYDTVHIRDRRVGVAADIDLVGITWQVRGERVSRAEFGALAGLMPAILNWQIKGLSGAKLLPGSVPAEKIAGESVTAELLKDGSVTGAKLADGAVTAGKLAGDVWAEVQRMIDAGGTA